MDPSFLLILFLSGLTKGMVVFIIASGLSLIFGVLRILNFAHGSLYMVGSYLTFTFVGLFGTSPARFWIAALAGSSAVALLGGLIERFLLRPLYGREELYQLLLTYALVLLFGDAVKRSWGTENLSVSRPSVLAGSVSLLGNSFPTYSLFIALVGPLIALGLWYLLQRTRWGRIVRAAVFDREMVGALGVNVSALYLATFVLGAWLAGLGGALAAPMGSIYLGMDVDVIVEAFIVVVIGGMGSLWGTLLGALVLGQVESFGILLIPKFELVFVYVLMAVVLMIRPWGLLGKPIGR